MHLFERMILKKYKRILIAITQKPLQLLNSEGKSLSDMWKHGNLDAAFAETFTKIMHSSIFPATISAIDSGIFANTSHLLDIGGGSGCFSKYFINCYPKSEATIFELPSVCNLLKNNIKNKNINIYSGNFFIDEFPMNCDSILLSNILHD